MIWLSVGFDIVTTILFNGKLFSVQYCLCTVMTSSLET